MERDGLGPSSVNGLRTTLHTVYTRARKAGLWTGTNPAVDVERRRVPRKVPATLRADEVPLLLAHVPPEWRTLFAAAIYTGIRKGELFGLRRQDVDLTSDVITVARSYDRSSMNGIEWKDGKARRFEARRLMRGRTGWTGSRGHWPTWWRLKQTGHQGPCSRTIVSSRARFSACLAAAASSFSRFRSTLAVRTPPRRPGTRRP